MSVLDCRACGSEIRHISHRLSAACPVEECSERTPIGGPTKARSNGPRLVDFADRHEQRRDTWGSVVPGKVSVHNRTGTVTR